MMPVVRGRSIQVLFDAKTIAARNSEIAAEIAAAGYRELLVISILKGSFVFAADLIRALHDAGLAPEVEFISLSSYRASTVSSGKVAVLRDIDSDVAGRDVLLIDDILESGRTVAFAKETMKERGANRVAVAVLLSTSRESGSRRSRRIMSVSPAPIISSSAMAWIWAMPSANCPMSA